MELSKYIWQLKDESKNYNIRWKIFLYETPYKCGTRRCDLCLTEKYVMASADQEHSLSKRTEIISKCRHRNKYLIKNVKECYMLNTVSFNMYRLSADKSIKVVHIINQGLKQKQLKSSYD